MTPLLFQNLFTVFLVVAGVWLYIMPTLEAYKSNHPQRRAITMLNVLAGWTFIGWVVAMVWARIENPYDKRPDYPKGH